MPKHVFFAGGVHPDEHKEATAGLPVCDAPLLKTYAVPLMQHIGALPTLVVKKGDQVCRGQLLAEANGFVSAPVHSPTSGVITAIEPRPGPLGRPSQCVVIEADGKDTPAPPLPPMPDWRERTPQEIHDRVREAGIVGMGGAAFPASVKLKPTEKVDTLLVNGAECEPCLTADHRLMLEEPEKVVLGSKILAHALEAKRVIIGVENNKPDAIKALTEAAAGDASVTVVKMRVRYPQGSEKQLIYALTGKKVPSGSLPMHVGCAVQNAGTTAAVAEAVIDGKPSYERITTITGTPVVNPGNWRIRVGTSLEDMLIISGGVKSDPAKIILGGPMMGRAVYDMSIPAMKNTSGVVLMAPEEVSQYTSDPCLRCGRCVDACPMNLRPGTLSVQIQHEQYELAEKWNVSDCLECGCCAYACPSRRPLVQHMRRGKKEAVRIRKERDARSRAADGKGK